MTGTDTNGGREGTSRRRFLGLACTGGFAAVAGGCLLGLARAVMPRVTPDPAAEFKAGRPDDVMEGQVVNFEDEHVLLFRDGDGFYAISTVCTHLGCIVAFDKSKGFACPCHGSKFDTQGKVTSGPAPASLPWLKVSVLPSGHLAVDRSKPVPMGTRFSV